MMLIGHELKTPLTTISSFLDLLKEEKLAPDITKYINRINQGSDRLKEIVFDVLDILGAETGQTKLKREKQSVLSVVKQISAEFDSMIEKKSLTVELESTDVKLPYDAILIGKVLRKILHNAIKFSKDDSKIEINLEKRDETIFLKVTNHGSPLDKNKIAQILKPFALDEDIMNHSQGMGLGLSVSQSLLKRHGTELQIESDAKKTSVGFELPL